MPAEGLNTSGKPSVMNQSYSSSAKSDSLPLVLKPYPAVKATAVPRRVEVFLSSYLGEKVYSSSAQSGPAPRQTLCCLVMLSRARI